MGVTASTGLRFFATGEALVKKTFDELGNSGKKMWAGIASGKDQALPGMRALSNGANEIKFAVEGVIGQAGPFGRIIAGLGPAGIAAATGIGAAALAFHEARKAMEDMASIGEAAANIATTTDALQEFRFVIEQTGGTAQDADAALQAFTQNFGLARAGNPRSLKWFEALGFTREDLKQVETASDMLPEIVRRIANLKSTAEQAGIADKLGIAALLPAIREGVGAIDQMIRKAHEMGAIFDADMIRKAKETEDQYKAVSKVIDVQLKQAFVDLAPILVSVLGTIAEIAKWFGRIVDDAREINNMSSAGLERRARTLNLENLSLMKRFGVVELLKPPGPPVRAASYDALNQRGIPAQYSPLDEARMRYQKNWQEIQSIHAERAKRAAENAPPAAAGTGTIDVGDPTGSKAKAFLDAMAAARQRYLKAQEDETTSIEQRLALEKQRLDDERDARAKELASQVKADQFTQAQADAIMAAEQEARDSEKHRLEIKAQRDRAAVDARYQDQLASIVIDILKTQESYALTAKERLAVQLVILEAERQQARKALEQSLSLNPNLTPEQRQTQLGEFDRQTAAMRGAAVRSSGEDWKEFARHTTYDALHDAVHDAFENNRDFLDSLFGGIAKRFASKLEDELTDALWSLGESLFKGGKSGNGTSSGIVGFLSNGLSALGHLLGFAPGTGASGVGPGVAFRGGEQGTEMMLIGRAGRIFDTDATAQLLDRIGSANGGSIVVKATYAPTNNFRGTGEEIAQMRKVVEDDRAQFAGKVHAAVNDGLSRGYIRDTRRR